MSRTKRWWNKSKNSFLFQKKLGNCTESWKNINPFYFKHEFKLIRVKIHRAVRRRNKVNLLKGFDIEPEQKTNGWNTH